MRYTFKSYLLVTLGFLFMLVGFVLIPPVRANLSSSINTRIKISICGNDVIEGGEDCEGINLNNQTCESIGYGPGTLSCDIACSFDTYECAEPTPTPTPIPTPTPTSSPTSSSDSTTSTNTSTAANQGSSTPAQISTSLLDLIPTTVQNQNNKTITPHFVILFDPNKDGKMGRDEVYDIVQKWVADWRKAQANQSNNAPEEDLNNMAIVCDVNQDSVCNIKDFSTLLAFIDNDN